MELTAIALNEALKQIRVLTDEVTSLKEQVVVLEQRLNEKLEDVSTSS